jgi:hypothetical protein
MARLHSQAFLLRGQSDIAEFGQRHRFVGHVSDTGSIVGLVIVLALQALTH